MRAVSSMENFRSILLSHILPRAHVSEKSDLYRSLETLDEIVNSNGEVFLSGSSAEGLNLPEMCRRRDGAPIYSSDVDMMIELDLLTVRSRSAKDVDKAAAVIETCHTHPGYLRLLVAHASRLSETRIRKDIDRGIIARKECGHKRLYFRNSILAADEDENSNSESDDDVYAESPYPPGDTGIATFGEREKLRECIYTRTDANSLRTRNKDDATIIERGEDYVQTRHGPAINTKVDKALRFEQKISEHKCICKNVLVTAKLRYR